MNRKFRIWCKDHEEWEKDSILLNRFGDVFHHSHRNGNIINIRPDSHVVQFSTGIYDIDGDEIYEGDVCEYNLKNLANEVVDSFKGVVVFHRCSFRLDGENHGNETTYLEDYLSNDIHSLLKIVGHIHEKQKK